MQESVAQEAMRLRAIAHAGPIGKRHSSFELYDLLAKCYALANRCKKPEAFEELSRLLREQPCEGKGRWVLKTSDEFLLVCRYVFPRKGHGRGELTNASRYAHCLRQAEKRNIPPHELASWLRENGGVNALFLRRPLIRKTVKTKTLYLAEQIEVWKNKPFTLTLKRLPDNRYEVLEVKYHD